MILQEAKTNLEEMEWNHAKKTLTSLTCAELHTSGSLDRRASMTDQGSDVRTNSEQRTYKRTACLMTEFATLCCSEGQEREVVHERSVSQDRI